MFGRIAGAYDRANDVLSLGVHRAWKGRLVREAAPVGGSRVLDVATGTGDLAFRFAQVRPAPALVIGADFCAPMLEVARRRAGESGRGQVEFREADALALPFEDASFDRVSVAFGVRNFEDTRKGLSELWRVLAPGGRLLVLEFGDWAQGEGLLALFTGAARTLIPWVGGRLSGDSGAYRYLFESSSSFPGGRRFVPLLEALPGSRGARAIRLSAGIAWLYVVDKG